MKNRRKKKLIDKRVQGRLVLGIAVHWLLYFLLIITTIPLWHMVTVSGFMKPFPEVFAESLARSSPAYIFLAAVLPIFIWETIKLSNRFTGPMYRLHETIRRINAGETFEPLHFRKGDFWQEVADDFNTMMERLADRNAVGKAEQQGVGQSQEDDEPVAVG